MNLKNKIRIYFAGAFLAIFFAVGLSQTVYAEDVPPTPEVTPTESATPEPTDPIPTEIITLESTNLMPTESATPNPTDMMTPVLTETAILTDTPTDEAMVKSLIGDFTPMFASSSDSVWFMYNGSRQNFFTISDAIDTLKTEYWVPQDGIIHIDASYGTDTDEPYYVDDDKSLTFYPEMSGSISTTWLKEIRGPELDKSTQAPVVCINSPLAVYGFTNGMKISNIQIITDTSTLTPDPGQVISALTLLNISGTVTLSNLDLNNADSSGFGLLVSTEKGNIAITNVKSDDNAGGGADLSTISTGSISITNSSFDNNGGNDLGNGLSVGTNTDNPVVYSPISINGISASGNGSTNNQNAALLIKRSGALTIRNSMFNDNYNGGINDGDFSIHGPLILDNITASNNYQDNSDPNPDTGGTGINLQVKGNITASNISAENNLVDGINLLAYGNITANNITATGNLGEGMHLDTCDFDGLACISKVTGNVTILNGTFEKNLTLASNQAEVWVEARGAINLTNVIGSQYAESMPEATAAYGAYLKNDHTTGLVFPVKVTNGSFIGNFNSGLMIYSLGTVSVFKVTADSNFTGNGVYIENVNGTSGVTISGKAAGDNHFNSNGSHGLEVKSKGNIGVNSLVANDNTGNGTYLDNTSGKGVINVSNSTFDENKRGAGLVVKSKNSVTLTDIQATGNNNDGIPELVDLCDGINLDNRLSGNGFGNIVLTRIIANQNYGWGINVITNGQITGNGITAENNKYGGGFFNNQEPVLLKNVILTNSIFSNNNTDNIYFRKPGLLVRSNGSITLTGVGASGNGVTGVDGSNGITLENTRTGYTGAVTIINSMNPALYSISQNNGLGLDIVSSNGAVLLNGVYADENLSGGAEIHNRQDTGTWNVTIQNSHFNSNTDGFGLNVDTKGAISLTKTDASGNASYGAELDNEYAQKYSPITITNDAKNIGKDLNGFSNNDSTGIIIIARGAVTLANVDANVNGSDGATIDIINALNYDLKITNSHFDGNESGGSGLIITSSGNINLSGGSASGNDEHGAALDNQLADPAVIKTVSISNFKFNDNINGYGLDIKSNGMVSLTGVESNHNYGNGTTISNASKSNPDVKITNSHFNNNLNNGSGITVTTNGNIILNTGSACVNAANGGTLNNQEAGKPNKKSITLINFLFNQNIAGYGLDAKATGSISLTNVQGIQNGTYGISLDNNYQDISDPMLPWIPGMGVTVKNVTTSGNIDGNGLEVNTKGTVLLDLITANGNTKGDGVKITSTPFIAGTKSVTINRTSANNSNNSGVEVICDGLILINGLSANNNLTFGASLDNHSQAINSGVTILATLGLNSFNLNQNGDGLSIISRGQVSLVSVTANGNTGGNGIFINNQNCSGDGCPVSNVILNKITTKDNSGNGVIIEDTNAASVSISGLISLSNDGSGVRIVSQNSLAKISLINSMFMANLGYGIEIVKISSSKPILTGTVYFGNVAGNLYIH